MHNKNLCILILLHKISIFLLLSSELLLKLDNSISPNSAKFCFLVVQNHFSQKFREVH